MILRKDAEAARAMAAEMIKKAGLAVTVAEIAAMDVADLGLGRPAIEGGQLLHLFNTEKLSAKIIALFPGQTFPEHWHVSVRENIPGKEEVLRVAWGTLYIVREGEGALRFAKIPAGKEAFYTCCNEQVLTPGEQVILPPGEKHWFQAGPEGAVVYSISSTAFDALDPFADPDIVRVTVIQEQ